MPDTFDVAPAVPVAANIPAADDVLAFYDRSEGVWKVIEYDTLLDSLIRLAASGRIRTIAGNLYVLTSDGTAMIRIEDDATYMDLGQSVTIDRTSLRRLKLSADEYQLSSASGDWGITRGGAGVVSITNGSTGGGTLRSIPSTPAQITGNQNDYAHGNARILRLDVDANRTITGFVAGVDGQEMRVQNINTGGFRITVANDSASSAAANRVLNSTGANVDVLAGTWMDLWYDGTTGKWRSKY